MTDKLILKREKFIKKICDDNGWNSKELTSNQFLIIARHPDFPKAKK